MRGTPLYSGQIIHENKVAWVELSNITPNDYDGAKYCIEISDDNTSSSFYQKPIELSGTFLAITNIEKHELYRLLIQFKDDLPNIITSEAKDIFVYPEYDSNQQIVIIGNLIRVYFDHNPKGTLTLEVVKNSCQMSNVDIKDVFEFFVSNRALEFYDPNHTFVRATENWYSILIAIVERMKNIEPSNNKSNKYYYNIYESMSSNESEQIASYINDLGSQIKLNYKGDIRLAWDDMEPYSIKDITISSDIDSSVFSIINVDVSLGGPFKVGNEFGLVSYKRYGEITNIPKHLYLAYFTSIIILLAETKPISEIGGAWKDGPSNTEHYINNGVIPKYIDGMVSKLTLNNARLFDLHNSVRRILEAIKIELKNKNNEKEPKKIANREQDVKLSESVIVEKFELGEYGVYNDGIGGSDLLNYNDYADAFAKIILNEETETPITIGILAAWGRGKTKLLDLMKRKLANSDNKNNSNIEIIDFDVWKYARHEEIHIGFINSILQHIESKLNWWQKRKLASILRKKEFQGLKRIAFSIGIVLLITAVCVATWNLLDGWILFTVIATLSGVTILSVLKTIIKLAWKIFKNPATESIIELTKYPDYRIFLSPLHKINSEVQMTIDYFQSKLHNGKIVIFIDDLDRCETKHILSALEAMKHFIETSGLIFVFAMDIKIVRMAVGQHYKFMGDSESIIDKMGNAYLEKMIQIPFHLPDIRPSQFSVFARELLSKYQSQVSDSSLPDKEEGRHTIDKKTDETSKKQNVVPETPTQDIPQSLDAIMEKLELLESETDRIIENAERPELNMSPRLFKRFLNIYLVARHLHLVKATRNPERYNDGTGPTDTFIDWMMLSCLYPRETAFLLKWFEANNWTKAPDKNIYNNASKAPSNSNNSDENSDFEKFGLILDLKKLEDCLKVYQKLKLSVDQVKIYREIICCFSVYLD